MFFLWVNTIKIKKINKINDVLTVIIKFELDGISFIALRAGKALSLINVTTNTVIVENIDETEEYLNIKVTTNHVKINKTLSPYDKANKTPK